MSKSISVTCCYTELLNIGDSLWEKGALHSKIEIEISAPEVSHRKNSFFLLFLFFAELVLVTLTLSLRQISNAETT